MNQKHQNPLFSNTNLISSKPSSNLRCSSLTASLSVFVPSVKLKIVTQFLKGRNFPHSVWVVFHFSQRTNCCCVLKPNFDHFYPKFSEDWFTFCLIQLFTNDKLLNQEPAFLLYTLFSIINFSLCLGFQSMFNMFQFHRLLVLILERH